jgi:predicted PP-loop superfamily ATPase
MFQLYGQQLRLEHRHSDGTWATLEPETPHHDSAEHDAERGWLQGKIFRCTRCEEEVRVSVEPGTESETRP